MKAKPLRLDGGTYHRCEPAEATHVEIWMPGPSGPLHLPVMISGTRSGTGNWTWNGDTEKPTFRPSVLTRGTMQPTDEEWKIIQAGGRITPRDYVCHSWVTDGQAQFLGDSTHEFANQTIDLLDV